MVAANFDARKTLAEAKQQRATIASHVAAARKRIAKEEEERHVAEAYLAVCGASPVIGAWDGEIVGLESAIAETAHDPDLIDVENCSEPELSKGACWIFDCNVRGKNMFGAKIMQRKAYSYSKALGFREAK